MDNGLDQLENCTDIGDVRAALNSVCGRFGAIARLDILAANQGGKRQALCFMRMDSPEQETQLIRALGVGRFGGDLVLVVDLTPADMERTKPVHSQLPPVVPLRPERDTPSSLAGRATRYP